MNNNAIGLLLLVVLVGITAIWLPGSADAQREAPLDAQADGAATVNNGQARALKTAATVGRYAVSASDTSTVLVDTTSGSAWLLASSVDGAGSDTVWLPVRRIDRLQDARQWIDLQDALMPRIDEIRQLRQRLADADSLLRQASAVTTDPNNASVRRARSLKAVLERELAKLESELRSAQSRR